MKLKIGDKVYLQKYDVAYILHDLKAFPSGVLNETFDDNQCKAFIMNGPADGFQFKCIYKDPIDVKWLMEQDWIVDYDEYAGMPLAELESLCERLKVEHSESIDGFNAKDEAYRKMHFDTQKDNLNKLGHKIVSLEHLVGFRKDNVKFIFPDEYRGKTTFTSKPQKKLGFFARLFGRSTQ